MSWDGLALGVGWHDWHELSLDIAGLLEAETVTVLCSAEALKQKFQNKIDNIR